MPSVSDTKNLTEFHKKRDGKLGVRNECKLCRRNARENSSSLAVQRKRDWYKKNKKRILENKKRCYDKNREQRLLYSKLYYEEHKEERLKYGKKYYVRNKDRIRKCNKEWIKNNYLKYRKIANINDRKRRDREVAFGDNYSALDTQITYNVFKNKCFKCGSRKNLAVDHHKPLSKGFPLSIKCSDIM